MKLHLVNLYHIGLFKISFFRTRSLNVVHVCNGDNIVGSDYPKRIKLKHTYLFLFDLVFFSINRCFDEDDVSVALISCSHLVELEKYSCLKP